MKYPKRSQYKYRKSQYRVRNWPEYEAGLRRRGDLTIWFSEDAIKSWREPPSGKPGGQRIYADLAIEAALTLRMIFHLPLRQTEGFLRSLADLLEAELPIPGLLEQISDPIASVSADGAYDTRAVYEAAHGRGRGRAVRVLIPPGRDAQLAPRPSAALEERNRKILTTMTLLGMPDSYRVA